MSRAPDVGFVACYVRPWLRWNAQSPSSPRQMMSGTIFGLDQSPDGETVDRRSARRKNAIWGSERESCP